MTTTQQLLLVNTFLFYNIKKLSVAIDLLSKPAVCRTWPTVFCFLMKLLILVILPKEKHASGLISNALVTGERNQKLVLLIYYCIVYNLFQIKYL